MSQRIVVLSLFAWLASSSVALAAPETRSAIMLREKASASSKSVDRVGPGKKVRVLGYSPDGKWARIEVGGHEGWALISQLKGVRAPRAGQGEEEEGGADEGAAEQPLAQKRNVRPDAWVSKSKYHEDAAHMTVTSPKAELYGRPASGGAAIGVLKRGEVVAFVKRSADRRWVMIDMGAGETAWVESKHLRAGGDPNAGAVVDEPPPPPPPPTRKSTPPPPPEPPPPPPPPPVAKKGKKVEPVAVAPPPPPPPPPKREPVVQREPEPEPEPEPPPPPKKKKKVAPPPEDTIAAKGYQEEIDHIPGPMYFRTPNYGWATARVGMSVMSQRLTTNTGVGKLPNYEATTQGLGVQIEGGYLRAVGQYLRFGAELSYRFYGIGAYRVPPSIVNTDGSRILLDLVSHVMNATLVGAVHIPRAGGLDIRLRIGGELQLNRIAKNPRALIPDDNVIGMTIGLALAFPNIVRIANRPFGLHAFGGGLVPATRQQQPALKDGTHDSTYGAFFGGGLTYALMKYLVLEAQYGYSFAVSHFTGAAAPDRQLGTVTVADRGSAQQLLTLGFNFHY